MLQSIIAGLVHGGAYALLGVCIAVMFRMVRVLNFAQAAIGAFGAYVAIVLSGHGWSYAPAAIVGALAAAGIAAVCGLLMALWFADAGAELRSTVAIAMFIALLTIGFHVFGKDPRSVPELAPGKSVEVAGLIISVSSIVLVVATIVVAGTVDLFLKRTHLGVRLRAQAERPTTAELLGVPARWIAVGVWAVTGALAALGTLVVAPDRNPAYLNLSLLVLPAIAAAALGLFRSTWLAVVGGIFIGLVEGLIQNSDGLKAYGNAFPLIIIMAVLLVSQRRQVWDAQN